MRVPNESLDDFTASQRKPSEPPSLKLVRPSGDVEVLKPLARAELHPQADIKTAAYVPPAAFPGHGQELSWFLRSIAAVGAFAGVVAVVLGSSILIGIYDPPVAEDQGPRQIERLQVTQSRPPKAPTPFNSSPAEISAGNVTEALRPVPAVMRSRPARPRAVAAVYRPRRSRRQLILTKFVPTTLIIYPENGVIKTRIEPQLTAAYRRPVTFSN
jgi:hypothetical protein